MRLSDSQSIEGQIMPADMDRNTAAASHPIVRRKIRWRPSRMAGFGVSLIVLVVGIIFWGQGAWAQWLALLG